MIRSFGNDLTAAIFHVERTRETDRVDDRLIKLAARKLDMLAAAHQVADLRAPRGNRLEALRGDLSG